jgi:hypothetical protein
VTAVSSKGVQVRTLLPSALEAFEYGSELLSEPRVSKWSWVWDLPNQILVHLHFYLLEEICYRPFHPLAKRAWSCLVEHDCKYHSEGTAQTSPNSLDAKFGILYSAAKRLKFQEAASGTVSDQSLHKFQLTSQNIATTDSNDLAPASWAGSTEAVSQTALPPNFAAAQSFDYDPISHRDAPGMGTQDSSMTRGFNGSLLGSTALSHPEATPSQGQRSLRVEGISTDSGSSEFSSQNISTQDSAWFQFRDENMGVEEYSDGMWEALLTDLPTIV